MLKSLAISGIYVLDQQKALDFYVGKLGLEVHTDTDLGFMRWLTINVPGDTTREIVLETPGRPAMDDKTAEQVRELVTKGAAGGHLFFTTDDCRGTYETLKKRGVEFTEEPTERPYGIACATPLATTSGSPSRPTSPRAASRTESRSSPWAGCRCAPRPGT